MHIKINKNLLIILVIMFGSISVSAKQYDLATVLELAKKNNKEIKLAKAELRTANALKLEAFSSALPKLHVNAGYNRNFMDTFFYVNITDSLGNNSTNKFAVTFKNDYQVNAVLSQTLLTFGRIGSAIKAAGYFKEFTNNQYKNSYNDVITRVKKAFYQALLLQNVWNVAQDSEASAKDNYENIKIKYDAGAVSEFELLQAETRWQNSIPETIRARQNFELAINNLKALVQIPFSDKVELRGNLENFPAFPDSIALQEVLQSRPDYKALNWQRKLSEKNVKIQFSNYLPTLTGNAVYTYSGRSDRWAVENDNDNFLVGLNLNIPLFSGFYTRAQVQKARVEVDKVQTRIDLLYDNIQIEMQNIYLRLHEAKQRINAANKSVGTARRAFEIAETRVRNGLATQLELKDSRILLDQAQLNYYSSIYDYLAAYFDWQNATGHVSLNDV